MDRVVVGCTNPACSPGGGSRQNRTGAKPNILVIFGDDIGLWNVGAYSHRMMGRTPAIDSLARHDWKRVFAFQEK